MGLSRNSTGNDSGALRLSEGRLASQPAIFVRSKQRGRHEVPFRHNHESARSIASSLTRH
jgi:hypothetical protein